MNEKEAEKIIMRTSAMLTAKEAITLFELAEKCQGDIVEIGAYLGGSAVFLAKGLREPYKVYSIDSRKFCSKNNDAGIDKIPENISFVFRQNIKKEGVEKKIVTIEKTSRSAGRWWRKKYAFYG